MNDNKTIVKKAFKGYAQHIDKIVYSKLDQWCVEILRSAIAFRMQESNNGSAGHNFTGNLINSICVLLYRKSTHDVTKYFGYDKAGLKLPIRREVSAMTYRKTRRGNRVYFRPGSKFGSVDWSGEYSVMKPSNLIPTDESWGQNDAQQFAQQWIPSNPNCDFVICVAYTSEYASFVEQERNTTGILQTESFVGYSAIELVGLKAA